MRDDDCTLLKETVRIAAIRLAVIAATLTGCFGRAELRSAEGDMSNLQVSPARFTLSNSRSRQQLLVSGTPVAGDPREEADLTRLATFESLVPTVALVTQTGRRGAQWLWHDRNRRSLRGPRNASDSRSDQIRRS